MELIESICKDGSVFANSGCSHTGMHFLQYFEKATIDDSFNAIFVPVENTGYVIQLFCNC